MIGGRSSSIKPVIILPIPTIVVLILGRMFLPNANADSVKSGANFRNLVVDIKHTLGDLEIQNFFIAEYNNFRINPEVVKCDYYDFLAGEPSAIKKFAGEFMSQFSWAEEAAGFLEQKALKKY